MGRQVLLPKTKCCVSSTRCDRCPIRLLKEGKLPAGYGVHKRTLVKVEATGKKADRTTGHKRGKVKKSELAAAVRKQKKSAKKKLAA